MNETECPFKRKSKEIAEIMTKLQAINRKNNLSLNYPIKRIGKKRDGKSKFAMSVNDYPIRNQFDVSEGNIQVLKTIPLMMQDPIWRNKLRELCLDFIFKHGNYGHL